MDTVGSMEITTVVGCKHMCVYCPQEKVVAAYSMLSDDSKMSFSNFKMYLKKMPKELHIDFSGFAEPWMNPNCTDMVLHAFESGFTVSVFTTAEKLSLKDISQVKKMPFHKFIVHLPDNDKYMKLSVNDTYLETIHELASCKIRNLHFMSIGKVHQSIKEINGLEVRNDPVIDRAANLNGLPGIVHQRRLKGRIKCKSCGDRLNHNVLLPNGDISLCCMDFSLKDIIGNLSVQNYEDLFQGLEYMKVKKGLTDESLNILCRYCTNAKRTGLSGYFWRKCSNEKEAETFLN